MASIWYQKVTHLFGQRGCIVGHFICISQFCQDVQSHCPMATLGATTDDRVQGHLRAFNKWNKHFGNPKCWSIQRNLGFNLGTCWFMYCNSCWFVYYLIYFVIHQHSKQISSCFENHGSEIVEKGFAARHPDIRQCYMCTNIYIYITPHEQSNQFI